MTDTQDSNMESPAYLLAALQWQLECGVDALMLDDALDRTNLPKLEIHAALTQKIASTQPTGIPMTTAPAPQTSFAEQAQAQVDNSESQSLGASEARAEAEKMAANITSLDDLKAAIKKFEGNTLKKTAHNMVFAEGIADKPKVMVIGGKPAVESDQSGKAFDGVSGRLMDRILASIGLSRTENSYLTYLCNWRPPGNDALTPLASSSSLPFLKKHIELIRPEFLILLGDDAVRTILDSPLSVSKLRSKMHEVAGIPTLVTFAPEILLTTPLRKKSVWQDMLRLKKAIEEA